MTKEQELKKSDVMVVVFIYAVCLVFWWLSLDLPEEAQTYPWCLIAGLMVLNTLFLGSGLRKLRPAGLKNDLGEIFADFLKGQFWVVLLGCTVYVGGIYLIGFYLASVVFIVALLLYLKVPALHTVLTVAALAAVIFAAFSWFLKVPLPAGLLFE